jgi:hypothetical protein
MSVKSFIAAARVSHPVTPSDEVELFHMFNVDITPYSDADVLPSCELSVDGETFYCNTGKGKGYLPLWTFKHNNPQKIGQLMTDKVKHAHAHEDYALPFLHEYPAGSRARVEQLERFYRDSGEQSAFDIPEELSLAAIQHITKELFHKHAEF